MLRTHATARRRLCIESLESRCLLTAGALDPTFGTGGLVTTNLGTQNSSYAFDLAVYHNEGAVNEGKIVAVGTALVSSRDQDLGIVRYNLDGSLDKSFAGSGQVITSLGTDNDGAHDVKIQPDGKVVVAGWTGGSGSDFAVLRYNADGSPDTSFGTKGKATTDINRSGDFCWTMGLQSDGKIVLAGVTYPKNTTNVDLAVVRYNTDGSVDTAFGTGGKVTRHFASPLSATINGGMDLAIDPTAGKIVIVTQFTQGPDLVLRLNTNGSPDVSFGGNGAGYVSLTTQCTNPAVAIQTDGHIVVTGSLFADIELARFNPDGTPDATFGSGGTVVTARPTTNEFARDVTFQPDGKIVVAGVDDSASGAGQFMVARYNPDGSQDTTFGVSGITDESVVQCRNDQAAVALEPDGRIVVAGPGIVGFGTNFALVRFLGDSPPATAPAVTASRAAGNGLTQPDAPTQARVSAADGQLPLSFEANQGQTDSRVNFLTRGAGFTLFLTPAKAVMELSRGDAGNVVAMRLVGANPVSRPVGLDKQAGVSNYLIGNDPSKWHTGEASFGAVDYQNAYRGIDLVYHGEQAQLEYDFVVKPGASPQAIRLAFDGTTGKTIDAQGNLILHTSGGDVAEHAPVAYQTINGVQHPVASRFVIGRDGRVGFEVGRYDHKLPLVIDPVLSLSYSTYLGGKSTDNGDAIAVDGAGNAYLTGVTFSTNFPKTSGALQSGYSGSGDAFVTKLNPILSGSASLIYSTYLGGSGRQEGLGIAVDRAGDAYVTGYTTSPDFPTQNAYQSYQGGQDVFVTKLNPSGSKLLYSTYLGGSGDEKGLGIAVDGAGKAYVTGYTIPQTGSTAFPTTSGAFITSGNGAFAAKLDPSTSGASSLVYSTLLGGNDGSAPDRSILSDSIAVDASGNAVVAGTTNSASFPTTAGAYQVGFGGGVSDAFVTKLNGTGSGVVFSTYLGGNALGAGDDYDQADGVALDSAGNVYVTGRTLSTNFPTTATAFQPNLDTSSWQGYSDAFVTKLSADGSKLLYSTYLGGSSYDNEQFGGSNPGIGGIAVDSSGIIYVTGSSNSTDFPTKYPFQTSGGGFSQAFVAKFDPGQSGGASLLYSTILGNTDTGFGRGIAAFTDASGSSYAYVTGSTYASDFPTTGNAFQRKSGGHGATDAFFAKLAFN